MAQATDNTLYTIGDVARRYQRAPSTIRLWEAAGRIPTSSRTVQGLRIWRGSDLDAVTQTIEDQAEEPRERARPAA